MSLCKKTIAIVYYILIICLLCACSLIPEEEEELAPPLVKPEREEYELYRVVRKDITNYVKGSGTLVASKEVPLYFRESGQRLKSIEVRIGDQVQKGDILAEADTGNLDSRIKLQEYSLKKAELKLAQLKEQDADKYSIESAEIDVLSNKVILEDLQKEKYNSFLIAPMDGIVTFIDNLSEGDVIEAYKRVITISDPTNLQVYHQSNNAIEIQTGMDAQLKYKGHMYTGKVILSPKDVPKDADESLKNAILIDAEGLPKDVQIGDLVEISIVIETKENAIVIPKRALKQYMGSNTVQIMEGDSKKELDIEIGIETPTEVEVVSGLEEGQKVILR